MSLFMAEKKNVSANSFYDDDVVSLFFLSFVVPLVALLLLLLLRVVGVVLRDLRGRAVGRGLRVHGHVAAVAAKT